MKNPDLKILIIDNDPEDGVLLKRLLRRVGLARDNLRFICGGTEAIAYFNGEGSYSDRTLHPFPDIVLCDLKMPFGDGFAVLDYLKSRPRTRIIPTLILSASADADDIKRAYAMGASCYLQKRPEQAEMERILKLFFDFWAECDIPKVDAEGRQLRTESAGKLGERYGQME